MLGLFAVLTIGLILVPAYAASPGSPLDQYNSGVPLKMIQCNDGKILMQSASGKPACITIVSAVFLADRGYSYVGMPMESGMIDDMMDDSRMDDLPGSMIKDNPTNTDEFVPNTELGKYPTKITVTTNSSKGGHASGGGYYFSDSTYTFPSTVNIGEEFIITYSVDPRDEKLTEEGIAFIKNFGMGIFYPNEISVLLNDDKYFFQADLYDKHGSFSTHSEFSEFTDPTFDGEIIFQLTDALYHDADVINISMGIHDRLSLKIEKTETGIKLSQSNYDPTDYSGNPFIGSGRNLGTIPDGVTTIENYIPQTRSEIEVVGEEGYEVYTHLPKDSWEGFAKMLRYYKVEFNIQNFTDYIVNNMGLSKEFADEYIESYPEFRTQSIQSGGENVEVKKTDYIIREDS